MIKLFQSLYKNLTLNQFLSKSNNKYYQNLWSCKSILVATLKFIEELLNSAKAKVINSKSVNESIDYKSLNKLCLKHVLNSRCHSKTVFSNYGLYLHKRKLNL